MTMGKSLQPTGGPSGTVFLLGDAPKLQSDAIGCKVERQKIVQGLHPTTCLPAKRPTRALCRCRLLMKLMRRPGERETVCVVWYRNLGKPRSQLRSELGRVTVIRHWVAVPSPKGAKPESGRINCRALGKRGDWRIQQWTRFHLHSVMWHPYLRYRR